MVPSNQTLKKRIASIADTALRVAYLRSELLAQSAAEVVALLRDTVADAEGQDADARSLLLTASLALSEPACARLRADVVTLAREQNLTDVTRVFVAASEPADAEDEKLPDFGQGRPLTLGERKSLARTLNRDLIARVLRDPHPDVVRILLGNPRLTELDVVRLCARRPQAPNVLAEVFRSTRWITRYAVRLTLIKNPSTPLAIALQLAPHLTTQDARAVAHAEYLDEALRRACERDGAAPTLH